MLDTVTISDPPLETTHDVVEAGLFSLTKGDTAYVDLIPVDQSDLHGSYMVRLFVLAASKNFSTLVAVRFFVGMRFLLYILVLPR